MTATQPGIPENLPTPCPDQAPLPLECAARMVDAMARGPARSDPAQLDRDNGRFHAHGFAFKDARRRAVSNRTPPFCNLQEVEKQLTSLGAPEMAGRMFGLDRPPESPAEGRPLFMTLMMRDAITPSLIRGPNWNGATESASCWSGLVLAKPMLGTGSRAVPRSCGLMRSLGQISDYLPPPFRGKDPYTDGRISTSGPARDVIASRALPISRLGPMRSLLDLHGDRELPID